MKNSNSNGPRPEGGNKKSLDPTSLVQKPSTPKQPETPAAPPPRQGPTDAPPPETSEGAQDSGKSS